MRAELEQIRKEALKIVGRIDGLIKGLDDAEEIIDHAFKNIEIKDIKGDLPRKDYAPQNDIDKKIGIVIHHSYTHSSKGGSKPEGYANYHVNSLGWPCIGYDRVCQPLEKVVYRTAYLADKNYHSGSRSHPGDENALYYAVCLSGNYDQERPREVDYEMIVVACLDIIMAHEMATGEKGWEPIILPHSHFAAKSCPGKNIDMLKIRRMVEERRK